MSKEMAIMASDGLKGVVKNWKKSLAELNFMIIEGNLLGNGHSLIKVEKWQDELKRFPTSEDSMAVLHVEWVDDEIDGLVEEIKLFIKVRPGNLWLYSTVANIFAEMEPSEEDEELYGHYEKTDEEKAAINAAALLVAKEKVFSSFRNRDQREEFVAAFVKKANIEHLPRDFKYDIAYQAEQIREFGLLPSQARALKNEGLTVNDISRELGITKAKAQKMIEREIPEHIRELMS